jgi:N-acetylmuramoyl-L-alanine amidase
MLDKIIAFFKNLFSGFSKSEPVATPKPPPKEKPVTTSKPPPPEPDLPTDASELKADTASTVVVVSENEPVILQPGDDPAEAKILAEEREKIEESTTDPTPEPEPTTPKHKPRYLWCLDNGHGKLTAGKRSPKFEDGSRFFEYEFNRDIVKRIIEKLDEKGVKYFNVVPEVDTDNFLQGRVERANNKKSDLPKIFLSIHANAFGNSGWEAPKGIETWHFHNSRTGQALARVFQKHLISKTGWSNRRLKSYPGKKQFYVLRNTNMPAVLTENGFYTNKEECVLLMKEEIRQKIADAHVDSILEIEKNGI